MKFKESFSLIVDNHKPDDYTESIAFMKHFGLKCDCVGWTTIKLDSKEKLALVEEMKEKALEMGYQLRCHGYRKELVGEADWYFIEPRTSVNNDDWTWDDQGAEFYTTTIKGYKIPKGCHVIEMPYYKAVSKTFADACRELQLSGIDFMWVTDKGKYDAPPFFYLLPEKGFGAAVNGCSNRYNKPVGKFRLEQRRQRFYGDCQQVDEDGSHMELLARCFDKFEMAQVPTLIDKASAPDTDFAFLKREVLIQSKAAEKLIERGVLKWGDLQPAAYFDEGKHGRLISDYDWDEYLPVEIKVEHHENYKKWLEESRPSFNPKEKDALSLLRRAKKECSDSYNKALKKTVLETLTDTQLAPMMPYYKISNGCSINNEIDILPYEDVAKAHAEFLEDMQEDEMILDEMPELKTAVVIGVAANGDEILLMGDCSVKRYDHEDPYLSETWDSLQAFFYEQIEMDC